MQQAIVQIDQVSQADKLSGPKEASATTNVTQADQVAATAAPSKTELHAFNSEVSHARFDQIQQAEGAANSLKTADLGGRFDAGWKKNAIRVASNDAATGRQQDPGRFLGFALDFFLWSSACLFGRDAGARAAKAEQDHERSVQPAGFRCNQAWPQRGQAVQRLPRPIKAASWMAMTCCNGTSRWKASPCRPTCW